MAISASSITKSNTLEQLRTQFNNLVSDLTALEAGKVAFTEITTTTQNVTTMNVAEDGTIIFEGATADDHETTLTVVDPTADRTVSLPNASGTVIISDSSTNVTTLPDDLLIKDAGTIGNASVADIMTLASTGIVTFKDDIVIKDGGTIGTGTTAGAITIAAGGNVTFSGDITISGDDITMATNTSGNLLVADGTNFNSVAVGDLSEISTVASDDVLLAIDTSGGGLKKITRSTLTAGIVSGSEISNVVEDTTPQLGGDLDVNSNDIVSTSNGNINLLPNGTGKVIMDGNGSSGGVSISDGVIDLRTGTGNQAKILFYCESSNAHAQTLQAAPHSEAASNTLTLPSTGGSVDLVSTASTATLTNKTLTSAQINTALLPASADGATLGSATKEFSDLFLADGGTIQFGNDQEITLTHVADTGLNIKHTATADDKPIILTLQTGETDMAANDVMGAIRFQAPDEGTGTDAILVAAAIQAVSEGDFSSSANATRLEFHTAASEAAAAKMTLSSAGVLDVDGGVTIDNFTIDGTEIDLSSGDFTLDVEGDIILDSNDGVILFNDNGTTIATFQNSSNSLQIQSNVSDGDIKFRGNDGGTGIDALVLDMSAAGAATFNNNVTAFSDERLKSDIKTLKSSLEKVLQMRGVSYTRNDNVEGGEQIGVIAQEVEQLYPQVVLTADDEQGTKSVDYGRLTAVLIEAVKELSEIVNRDILSLKKDMDAICQHPLWQEHQKKGE